MKVSVALVPLLAGLGVAGPMHKREEHVAGVTDVANSINGAKVTDSINGAKVTDSINGAKSINSIDSIDSINGAKVTDVSDVTNVNRARSFDVTGVADGANVN
ncbi:hypothetical protein CBS147346_4165 [Aspergillus niger]|nr:hypothetical protein CBS147346_4165 [Aspergillus niger]